MDEPGPTNVLQGRDGSYALLEVIGKGAYGTVYKGIWREVGRHVAVKRVSRHRLSPDEKSALQTEIHLFKNLNNPHIVTYIEAVDNPDSAYLDIVMEYVEGGSLFSVIKSIRKSLPKPAHIFDESVVADFIRQVVLGLRYLHKQGVVHRDIKGANILITKESHVKLADFGVASTKPSADLSTSSPMEVAGSPNWMAPEIINLEGYSTASDIWSLGCTTVELLTGFPPYHELADFTALFRIVQDDCPPIPPNLSADCEDFLRKCFNKDVNTRASTDDLLVHRWLSPPRDLQHNPEKTPVEERNDPDALVTNHSAMSTNTHTSLVMYEEDDEDDFDDLDFDDAEDGLPGKPSTSGTLPPIPDERLANDTSQHESNHTTSHSASGNGPIQSELRRLSIRDDPFQDLMDDPEVDRERERLRKQKELWKLVKTRAAALGQREEAHVAACEALVNMFRSNPEQRYYLIYDPGLLPIIEVLESGGNGSERVVEAMLQVTLSLLDDATDDVEDAGALAGDAGVGAASQAEIASFGYPRVSNIREDLCLAGFLPVVMQYCRRSQPFQVRILAARFIEKMLELEKALHMFIACRGFLVFVDMLEPDIEQAGELSRIALGAIDRMLSMEKQRHKRDFCRRFAWSGLLDRIVDGINFSMNRINEMTDGNVNEDESVKNRLESHVTKLAFLLQTFAARAEPMVKAKMMTKPVLDPMIQQIAHRHVPESAAQSILCCIRDLSRDPQTHRALQSATAIDTLVEYLSVDTNPGADTKARHLIISSLHNLCIVSPSRQELAAKAGLVPHLQRYIRSQDINLRSLCIDMYSGLACAGPLTRVELSKHSGVDFYVELLVLLSVPGTVRKWQARVLQSVSEWLDDSSQSNFVENRLVLEKNRIRVCEALSKMRIIDVEGVLEPYLKMVTVSEKVNMVFGSSVELVSLMVRWLEEMYVESERLASGGPRGRLLLLRTLLAHARNWTAESDIRGVIGALRLLLTEVVLVTDEAITVREQASLLLDALNQTGVGVGVC